MSRKNQKDGKKHVNLMPLLEVAVRIGMEAGKNQEEYERVNGDSLFRVAASNKGYIYGSMAEHRPYSDTTLGWVDPRGKSYQQIAEEILEAVMKHDACKCCGLPLAELDYRFVENPRLCFNCC